MYKVIADSSADMNIEMREKYPVSLVPFKMSIGEKVYVDDENIDVDGFVEDFTKSKQVPKSACPSPNDFYSQMHGSDEIYIVTITGTLSSTYNSAILGQKLMESENKNAKIHVFDSKSASPAQALIIIKIHELKREGKSFEEIIPIVTDYIAELQTYFISESLNNLIKNGRISKWKGLIATTLNIIPIMGANKKGEIVLFEKIRNLNKAYNRLAEKVATELLNSGKKFIAISHVGNQERAEKLAEEFKKLGGIVEVFVSKCAGLSSMYADKKGIILAF